MRRVLLVQPLVNFEKTFPLGLAYIAAYLGRHGVEVEGFDARVSGAERLVEFLTGRSFDLVGITAYSSNLDDVARCAATIREHQPRALIVMGGPHATLGQPCPGDPSLWDYVVRGDGEVPMLALARDETGIPGVVPAGELMDDPEQIYLHPELSDLDFPDRDVFPVGDFYAGALHRELWTSVVASRGCSCHCAYCSAPRLSNGRHRRRDPLRVVEELRSLRADHNVGGVLLEDDNLFIDPQWARSLLEALASAGLKVRIDLPNGVNPMLLDEELIALAQRAGVTSISLGIESLVAENQVALGRVIDPDHLNRVIQSCHGLGVRIAGFFIIGLPADSVPGILRMYRDIRGLNLDLAHVSVYQDLPGLGLNAPPPSARRAATLSRLHRAFYPYYYADPVKIARVLRESGTSPEMLLKAARRFANWVVR